MIKRVRLENWRAYRHLDLPIEPGVTFLVAENGVGKSSLLEAVRWTLSAGSVPDNPSAIRNGNDYAAVSVTLTIEDGDLEVRREMRKHGSRVVTSFEAELNGRLLQASEYERLFSRIWAADLLFASKTAFLTEDLRAEREKDEPDLRSHLCQVYSLDDLQLALSEITPAITRANRSVRAARSELTATAEQLNAARLIRSELDAKNLLAQASLVAAREENVIAQAEMQSASAARKSQVVAHKWDEVRTTLEQDIDALIGAPSRDIALEDKLNSAKLSIREDLQSARDEQSRLNSRLESAEEALLALNASGGQCPVCLRDLDEESRENAKHSHSESLREIRKRLSGLDLRPTSLRLERVEALELRVAALGERPSISEDVDTDIASSRAIAAQANVELAAGALRELEVAIKAADLEVSRITKEVEEAEQLKIRYREVAVLEAAQKALNSTILSVLSDQLAPLSSAVNRRWQSVFPNRPNLRLAPDGTMSREIGGDTLTFASFSAGEKTVARLMMRLTTLLVTTKVPFCWVDEPLEHLDPESRRLVASMLVHISTKIGLGQIFITTYEEPLARRLAEFEPDRVRVKYLKAEQLVPGP